MEKGRPGPEVKSSRLPHSEAAQHRSSQHATSNSLESATEALDVTSASTPIRAPVSASAASSKHGLISAPRKPSRLFGFAALWPTRRCSQDLARYLKSIDFTSPSEKPRTYNVITQELQYNGCVFHRSALHTLTYRMTGQSMSVHRHMQYPDPA
jgi:hypothetical protein